MFISRGVKCESMIVEHKDHHRLVQENVASMKKQEWVEYIHTYLIIGGAV